MLEKISRLFEAKSMVEEILRNLSESYEYFEPDLSEYLESEGSITKWTLLEKYLRKITTKLTDYNSEDMIPAVIVESEEDLESIDLEEIGVDEEDEFQDAREMTPEKKFILEQIQALEEILNEVEERVKLAVEQAAKKADRAKKDQAMLDKAETPYGGINLNPALLDFEIKRDNNGFPLPINLQPIETINIDGFMPIIINVTPVPNLPLLLGLFDEVPSDDTPTEIGLDLSPAIVESKNRLPAREPAYSVWGRN